MPSYGRLLLVACGWLATVASYLIAGHAPATWLVGGVSCVAAFANPIGGLIYAFVLYPFGVRAIVLMIELSARIRVGARDNPGPDD